MSVAEVIYRPATLDDAVYLAPRLRAADAEELDAFDDTPHEAKLRRSIERSEVALAATDDGEPIAVLGVGRMSMLSSVGIIWMLGSDGIERHRREVLRASKVFLQCCERDYIMLRNFVYTGHHRSLRWLAWLGFTIHPAAPHGPKGSLFHLFERRFDV